MRSAVIVAVDVGSVRGPSGGNYAWAASDVHAGAVSRSRSGRQPGETLDVVVDALRDGVAVAVGWESPGVLPVPAPTDWRALGSARQGEGNRAWSAGAGAGALATGLVQAAWLLRAVRRLVDVPCTCDPTLWERRGGLLLWEAFVSGRGKPTPLVDELTARAPSQHEADAAAAVAAFVDCARSGTLTVGASEVSTGAHAPFNVFAAAALAAGLRVAAFELTNPLLVIKTRVPEGTREG